jgi:uncharacterized protein YchJ
MTNPYTYTAINGKPESCPCGRRDRRDAPMAYSMCCGRYIEDATGATPAPDAEALMRSRYSAFVRERADYLLATWHASTERERTSRPSHFTPDSNSIDAGRVLACQVASR